MPHRVEQALAALRGRLTAGHTDQSGATATEYGVLVGFIAIAIVLGVALFGTVLDAWFADFATAVGGW